VRRNRYTLRGYLLRQRRLEARWDALMQAAVLRALFVWCDLMEARRP
jgi:hypothetical protein